MSQGQRIIHLPRPSRLSQVLSARRRSLDIEIDTVGEILNRYGLEMTRPPRNLPVGRRNRNLTVETNAGKKLLKGYRPKWQVGTVRYAHSILSRLAQVDFPAPRLVLASDGTDLVNLAGDYYTLFDFVDGTNYSGNFLVRAHRKKLMALAGSTLARFHRKLEGFVPEGHHHMGFGAYTGNRWRDMAWHAAKVDELKEKSKELVGPEERIHAEWLIQNCDQILEKIIRLDEELSGAPLPRLVIHGDYGLHNLLFQKDGTITPVDFELARLEWRLSDLVSCLSRYRYGKHSEVVYDFESMRWFMEDYQAVYPLSADEWQLFPQVWRFYKAQGAVQYWNSYFLTAGPVRKLRSARDAMTQVDWVQQYPEGLLALNTRPAARVFTGSTKLRASDLSEPG
jgi:Ser/Thr protein kinase RdoA (MazF antagonist)